MHLLQVVRHKVTVWSSHVTQEIREILELKYRIGKPFQISKLYILCRHQFWGFGEIFDSAACSKRLGEAPFIRELLVEKFLQRFKTQTNYMIIIISIDSNNL